MGRQIVPIANLGTRMVEHGRIRLGVKAGKAMKSIDTFRFTSADKAAIEKLAELYGAKEGPRPWSDPKATPKNQYEVITQSNELNIWLPPDGLDVNYEQWTGGGRARVCNGKVCLIPREVGPDEFEEVETECICVAQDNMQCKPYTRLNVVFPDIDFGGTWRLETKGWNAAQEMPAMAATIFGFQSKGLLAAKLRLESRSTMTGGKKKNYVVPALAINATPQEMIQGQADVVAITRGEAPDMAALPAATEAAEEPWASTDDEVVEAELVEEETIQGEHHQRAIGDVMVALAVEALEHDKEAPFMKPEKVIEELRERFDDAQIADKLAKIVNGTAKFGRTPGKNQLAVVKR